SACYHRASRRRIATSASSTRGVARSMGKLTTHVLDTANGTPAAGMRIDFAAITRDAVRLLGTVYTNAEGRTSEPLLTADAMHVGEFELTFHVADYFLRQGAAVADPPFLD